jgi:hypothetical protein
MAGRQLTSPILSDDERLELKSLTTCRKTAQALALRIRMPFAQMPSARSTCARVAMAKI